MGTPAHLSHMNLNWKWGWNYFCASLVSTYPDTLEQRSYLPSLAITMSYIIDTGINKSEFSLELVLYILNSLRDSTVAESPSQLNILVVLDVCLIGHVFVAHSKFGN
jgi:hypothetical protein